MFGLLVTLCHYVGEYGLVTGADRILIQFILGSIRDIKTIAILLFMIPGCVDYGMLQKIGGSVVCLPGKTKLDRERTGLCLAEIVNLNSDIHNVHSANSCRKISEAQRDSGDLR